MRIGGFVTAAHDAGISIINEAGDIEFASASERFTKIKHDDLLPKTLIDQLSSVDLRVFYEDCLSPLWSRRGHPWDEILDSYPTSEKIAKDVFIMFNDPKNIIDFLAEEKLDHHRSHAASSFYTRPWETCDDTVILSIDGCGKDTWISNAIYTYEKETNTFDLKHKTGKSIGHFYSDVTEYLGFRNFEEGTVMGLSSFGEPKYYKLFLEIFNERSDLIDIPTLFKKIKSRDYDKHLFKFFDKRIDKSIPSWKEDVAASLQKIAEEQIIEWATLARQYGSKLCYAGGVAQNILANSKIKDLFDDIWIVSDPTDGGASLGAAAWAHAKEFKVDRINWIDAYLGHNIEKQINVKEVVNYILENKVCGIANGPAEFGPRALGNRSLVGDVRFDIKDTVNAIKQREKFRPFGPLILEEEFDKWFEGHTNGYMQYVCKPKHDMKSVIHVDGTSRVQTVPSDSRSMIRPILEEYFERTGIPMLLNTSLNIKGKPMVNDIADAEAFEKNYNVKVF